MCCWSVFHFLLDERNMMGKSGPKMKVFISECYFKGCLVSEHLAMQDICLLTYFSAESIYLKNITDLEPFNFFMLPS